jgi:hypothetical protein
MTDDEIALEAAKAIISAVIFRDYIGGQAQLLAKIQIIVLGAMKRRREP